MHRLAHMISLVSIFVLAACSGPVAPSLPSSVPTPTTLATNSALPTQPVSNLPNPPPTSGAAAPTGPAAVPSTNPAAGVIAACGIRPIPPATVSQTPRVLSMQMVTATAGWQTSTGKLADFAVSRTTDGGAHWQQVTPPGIWDHLIGATAFLGEANAWILLLLDDAPTPPQSARSVILRTDDGGATWRCGEPFVPGGVPGQMTFTDPQHGQLLVRRTDTARTETTATFVTDDNGAHWQMR